LGYYKHRGFLKIKDLKAEFQFLEIPTKRKEKNMIKKWILLLTLPVISTGLFAEEELKPFILAETKIGSVAVIADETRNKLSSAGFTIEGEYSPYDHAKILIVTNSTLKTVAAKSDFGAYGAAQRVSVTKLGEEIQISYTNPVYMSHAYRMSGDLSPVLADLKKALGYKEMYGPTKGLKDTEIRKYHYMMGMEYFTDPHLLNEFSSYEEAVAAVEKGLTANSTGVGKVYRIDIPGKNETVFGVALSGTGKDGKCRDDKFIMSEIDFKPVRSTGHLPYEIVVSGGKIYALSARFRIAINFPDLAMMGNNSFVNIMCAPDGIKNALKEATDKK
jgi:hypothetical protein